MNILVVGGGGREHAIIAALAKSSKVDKIYAAPGNGGISALAECHPVKATDIDGMVELAKKLQPDYVFVAPDDPLVLGMVDKLNENGFKTFGPRANAAQQLTKPLQIPKRQSLTSRNRTATLLLSSATVLLSARALSSPRISMKPRKLSKACFSAESSARAAAKS